MKKYLNWLILILLLNPAFGQKTKSKREPAPAVKMAPEPEDNKPIIISKPWFDYSADYKKYLYNEPCIHKNIYEKYIQIDSFPRLKVVGNNFNNYSEPCFKKINDSTIQDGISRNFMFLGMLFQKQMYCKSDGSNYENKYPRTTNLLNIFENKITEEAFELLKKHDEKAFTKNELDAMWDNAKIYLQNKDYQKSNAIYAFLTSIDERYLEAGLNNIGLSFYLKKEYRTALYYFEKVVRMYPNGYLGNLNLGNALEKIPVDMGDDNQSFIYFKRAYDLAPENPNVIFKYANSLDPYGRKDDEEINKLKNSLLIKAASLDTKNPSFKYKYATTLHQKAMETNHLKNEGILKQAMDVYKEGVQMSPDYPNNYIGIAKLYSFLRRCNKSPDNKIYGDSACIYLEKYRKLAPKELDIDQESLCIQLPEIKTKFVNSYKNLVPIGWEVLSIAKGDLNNDNIDDVVLIARESNTNKIKNIKRYNTPDHEEGIKNYNHCILSVLFANPSQNNFEIKVVNNELMDTYIGYYTQEFEVKIINKSFKLIRKENPQDNKEINKYALKNDTFILIGMEIERFRDNLGNLNSKPEKNPDYFPNYKFNVSYDYNAQTLSVSKDNLNNSGKETKSVPISIEEINLNDTSKKLGKIWREITQAIKTFDIR